MAPTSGLAKAAPFCRPCRASRGCMHQADWIAGQLSGRFDVSDENNALKTGYDPVARALAGLDRGTGGAWSCCRRCCRPATPVGRITGGRPRSVRPSQDAIVVAGTTDGCASFLATGAERARRCA